MDSEQGQDTSDGQPLAQCMVTSALDGLWRGPEVVGKHTPLHGHLCSSWLLGWSRGKVSKQSTLGAMVSFLKQLRFPSFLVLF